MTALDQLKSTKYIPRWINEVHVILLLNQYYLHYNIGNDNKVISCDNMNELMYHQKIITLVSHFSRKQQSPCHVDNDFHCFSFAPLPGKKY